VRRLLIVLLRLYKAGVSPYWPGQCRYLPTCSEYALEAVSRHGSLAGSWLAMRRLARCGPWHAGGFDPVPDSGRHDDARAMKRQVVTRIG
jgi:putative membrane protein insertion efficiency factor